MKFPEPVQFRWGPLSGLEGMALRARTGHRWGPEPLRAPWSGDGNDTAPGPLAAAARRRRDKDHDLAVRGKASRGR